MNCTNTVKTKSGTFTFYDEFVPLCEAKLKCLSMGQILAPVTSQRDAKRLMKFLKSNYGKENCPFANNVGGSYWIGLDITFEGNNQTNGKAWKEEVHGKIYKDHNKDLPTDCPIALFQPGYPPDRFFLTDENEGCTIKTINKYICLKPKKKKSQPNTLPKTKIVCKICLFYQLVWFVQ